MSRKIIELNSEVIDGKTIYECTDIDSRELLFFTEQDGELIPVSDKLKKQVLPKKEATSEVKDYLEELIKNEASECFEKNEEYGYSNPYSKEFLKNLNVVCKECALEESHAFYEAFSNTMDFNLPSIYLNASVLNIQFRLIFQQIISHEVGHMAVSELTFDDDGLIVASTGFLQRKIPIRESLKTLDGSDYYRLDHVNVIEENAGRGLEELFNILETDERTNGNTAPNFANRIDRITEGKLRYSRRRHSLDEYFDIMQSIIPSYERANVLLTLLKAYYQEIDKNDNELAMKIGGVIDKIIDDYEMYFLTNKSRNKTTMQ